MRQPSGRSTAPSREEVQDCGMRSEEFERIFRPNHTSAGPHTLDSPIRYEVWRNFALASKTELIDLLLEPTMDSVVDADRDPGPLSPRERRVRARRGAGDAGRTGRHQGQLRELHRDHRSAHIVAGRDRGREAAEPGAAFRAARAGANRARRRAQAPRTATSRCRGARR